MNDHTSIIDIKGIGEKTQKLFQKLDIFTVGDLLTHYPRDYETFKEPVLISEAVPGEVCAVRVCVTGIPNLKKIRNLNILNVTVRDASGGMQLTFFNMPFMKNLLKSGGFYIFRGLIQTRGPVKIMEQPRLYSQEEYNQHMQFIQSRYALTKGLSNQTIQKAVKQALTFYEYEQECYPKDFLDRHQLISYREAICSMHFPPDHDTLLKARRRMVFDEFFMFILLMQKNKDINANLPNSFPMKPSEEVKHFLKGMPFQLTNAQRKVWEEIECDLSGVSVMNRLIQGDVGSGKTIVAVLALLTCVCNGYQGAMMAPTEVLATQHYETICGYVKENNLPFHPVLLVGSMTAKEKREAYQLIDSGEANLIIGTHALIQDKVTYRSLALVITDEQHRFGVRQREKLAEKGMTPHVLVMSATPIPRTLAIILYGDLHISIIDELPANRLPIKNCVVNTSYRPKAYEFIERQVNSGRQAYVICPMVEEGELEEAENVMEYAQKLRAVLHPSIIIEPLHGKMKAAEKNRIMEDFAACRIHVLVSTTVIEVGINVPNATVMMVENAERFGL
ncbi:MAG: ATP-dependent DNA helicase RecG, partial [Lachnospiraceae bacterium]|nr:ATP-dependent DNA helicase RecG [Lachnospiraceae bacterium]